LSLVSVNVDEVSYNSVLHAMTKESDPKWLVVAEDMLHEMKEKNIPIGQITYHVLMNIYGKISDKNGARKAEMLLRGMEEEGLVATDISYNICIDAYARRGDCQKAESLLEEMISLSNCGRLDCRPSIHSFASVVRFLFRASESVYRDIVCSHLPLSHTISVIRSMH
jgi:pentatricopeptide repeat protein